MIRFAEVSTDAEIVSALRTQLGWTHYRQIIALYDPLKRDFYAEMARIERWSNRRNKVLAEHAAHILPYRGLGTGIPRALGAWPKIDLLDEREANQFRAVVWRPVSERVTEQVTPEATPQVTPQVGTLLTAMAGEMARQALMDALSLRDRKHFTEAYLLPALTAGLIEMTIPDKPNSSKQRYRLTERGLTLLADMNNEEPKQ